MPTRRPLFAAIEAGDVKAVEKLLTANVDINQLQEYGESRYGFTKYNIGPGNAIGVASGKLQFKLAPLHLAVLKGQLSIVMQLLEHGADVNLADNYGLTALHMAVLVRQQAIAELLIRQGAIQVNDECHVTPVELGQLFNHESLCSHKLSQYEKLKSSNLPQAANIANVVQAIQRLSAQLQQEKDVHIQTTLTYLRQQNIRLEQRNAHVSQQIQQTQLILALVTGGGLLLAIVVLVVLYKQYQALKQTRHSSHQSNAQTDKPQQLASHSDNLLQVNQNELRQRRTL